MAKTGEICVGRTELGFEATARVSCICAARINVGPAWARLRWVQPHDRIIINVPVRYIWTSSRWWVDNSLGTPPLHPNTTAPKNCTMGTVQRRSLDRVSVGVTGCPPMDTASSNLTTCKPAHSVFEYAAVTLRCPQLHRPGPSDKADQSTSPLRGKYSIRG